MERIEDLFRKDVPVPVKDQIDLVQWGEEGHNEDHIFINQLEGLGLSMYNEKGDLHFYPDQFLEKWRAKNGSYVGVDNHDYLYFVNSLKFKRRLLKIDRKENIQEHFHYNFKGGRLALKDMRWLPQGQYLFLYHEDFGILIFDPVHRKIGKLLGVIGTAFGWYTLLEQN